VQEVSGGPLPLFFITPELLTSRILKKVSMSFVSSFLPDAALSTDTRPGSCPNLFRG
jgi:hypothetical protein